MEFFSQGIQSFPPDFGRLRLPSAKSELLKCIDVEKLSENPIMWDCSILDGAVIVHLLQNHSVTMFGEYTEKLLCHI